MANKRKTRYSDPRRWEMEEFKEFLGPDLAGNYSEAELTQLRHDMHELAEILLDLYCEKDTLVDLLPVNAKKPQ